MIVVLMGSPGAGKGTQACRIADGLGVPHLSTGDMLRQAVAEGTEVGRKADTYMRSGSLVPDGIMLGLIGEVVERPECERGFVLDGFPRSLPQAEGLDRILERHGLAVDVVVLLDIDKEAAVSRILSRLSCACCCAVYNALTHPPPRADGACGRCGALLTSRTDDNRDTVARRFEQYRALTEPTIEYYRSCGRLRTVDAGGSIEEVGRAVSALIAEIGAL